MSSFPYALVVDGQLRPLQRSEQFVPWWSFTKTVLAATALTLVRDDLVSLDDVVLGGPFTLRQLLRHEAGLADYSELAEYHAAVSRQETPWPAEDMLERLDASRLRYEPGVGWRYSNVGYFYVARLIQQLTALSLEDALRERVLVPLGVSNARLAKTPDDLRDVNMGDAAAYHPGWVYHGLLVGTLSDAALLLDRLLGGNLLPDGLLQDMQTDRVLGGALTGRPWLTHGYALGLMQGTVEGGQVNTGHSGGGPGSVIAVYRFVTENCTASCAVFHEGDREGVVEQELVRTVTGALSQ